MRILGREPVLLPALLATCVQLVAAFWLNLGIDWQAVVNAVVALLAGLFIASIVKDGMVAAILGLAQAALALALGAGLDFTSRNQAVLMGATGIAVAMYVRTQVIPPVPPGGAV